MLCRRRTACRLVAILKQACSQLTAWLPCCCPWSGNASLQGSSLDMSGWPLHCCCAGMGFGAGRALQALCWINALVGTDSVWHGNACLKFMHFTNFVHEHNHYYMFGWRLPA